MSLARSIGEQEMRRAGAAAQGPRGFGVQRRAIGVRGPAVLELPLPGEADPEEVWRGAARDAVLSSRVRPFVGPVDVTLTFRDGPRARMIGGLPNACLQVLIGTGLIGAADSRVLRRLTLAWGGVVGVRIGIRPWVSGGHDEE